MYDSRQLIRWARGSLFGTVEVVFYFAIGQWPEVGRSRINCFRLCFEQFPGDDWRLFRWMRGFCCRVIPSGVQHTKKRNSLFEFRASRFVSGHWNWSTASTWAQHWPNNATRPIHSHRSPALSPVLQLMRTSHSEASIAKAVALARTYLDGLKCWLMLVCCSSRRPAAAELDNHSQSINSLLCVNSKQAGERLLLTATFPEVHSARIREFSNRFSLRCN